VTAQETSVIHPGDCDPNRADIVSQYLENDRHDEVNAQVLVTSHVIDLSGG
jgi:hypothetical protein